MLPYSLFYRAIILAVIRCDLLNEKDVQLFYKSEVALLQSLLKCSYLFNRVSSGRTIQLNGNGEARLSKKRLEIQCLSQ